MFFRLLAALPVCFVTSAVSRTRKDILTATHPLRPPLLTDFTPLSLPDALFCIPCRPGRAAPLSFPVSHFHIPSHLFPPACPRRISHIMGELRPFPLSAFSMTACRSVSSRPPSAPERRLRTVTCPPNRFPHGLRSPLCLSRRNAPSRIPAPWASCALAHFRIFDYRLLVSLLPPAVHEKTIRGRLLPSDYLSADFTTPPHLTLSPYLPHPGQAAPFSPFTFATASHSVSLITPAVSSIRNGPDSDYHRFTAISGTQNAPEHSHPISTMSHPEGGI